jgi:hypothetical protein
MKKIILFIAILAMPFYAQAQNLTAVSADVEVSARITAAMILAKQSDLNFGFYSVSGGTPSISAETGVGTGTSGGFTRGEVHFSSSTANQEFVITMSGPTVSGTEVTLVASDANNETLNATNSASLVADLTFWFTGQTNAAITLGANGPELDGTPEGTLFIGGSLEAIGTPMPDNYSATITISIDASI